MTRSGGCCAASVSACWPRGNFPQAVSGRFQRSAKKLADRQFVFDQQQERCGGDMITKSPKPEDRLTATSAPFAVAGKGDDEFRAALSVGWRP